MVYESIASSICEVYCCLFCRVADCDTEYDASMTNVLSIETGIVDRNIEYVQIIF